jgi:hypothetical protein
MLRRIGWAIRAVFSLVESVDQLRAKNEIWTANMSDLPREVDRQAGQINALMGFVRHALTNECARKRTPPLAPC